MKKMKKLALVSIIALFFVFAYAFTPATTVVVSPELNSYSVLEDTTKTVKSDKKKKSTKKYNKDCSTKCGSHFSTKKCGSSKDTKKKKTEKK